MPARQNAARRVAIAVVATAAAAVALPVATSSAGEISPAATPGAAAATVPTLSPGQSLQAGQSLTSQGAGFTLVAQSDGNLVEYLTTARRAVWQTATTCSTTVRFTMQNDGNAVLYCGTSARFATATRNGSGQSSGDEFAVGVDGQMAVVDPAAAEPAWTSPIVFDGGAVFAEIDSDSGVYHLVQQVDGNLVLYSTHGSTHALWSAGTAGNRDSFVLLQSDGNLVVYAPTRPVWSSGTAGTQAAILAVQDDGNVVLYEGNPSNPPRNPVAVWSTGTAGRA